MSDWGTDFVKADCMFPGSPYPPLRPPNGYFDDDLFGMTGAFKSANRRCEAAAAAAGCCCCCFFYIACC